MANEICSGLGNTGFYKNCDINFKLLRGIFLLNTYAEDGTENKIAAGTEINEAYLTARLNDTDKTKRWYPLMDLEQIAGERAETEFFTNDSGAREKIRQAVRSV